MTVKRPNWPAVLRPFIAYRPPLKRQPTRSESSRDVWADVCRFRDCAAKPYGRTGESVIITAHRWSSEGAKGKLAELNGEWPSECTMADFDDAMRLAHERFGKPRFRPSARALAASGEEFECHWRVSTKRIDEVLEFLDTVPTCTVGASAPVHAIYSCLVVLRDLKTGAVIRKQGSEHYPLQSSLTVGLQRRCWATLSLTLPFAVPTEPAADYAVALQEHAPVWLDPRYFDHMVPAPDGSRFQRTRLSPSWIGLTADGALRLDAAKSGITPETVDLPMDAELAAEDVARDDAPFQMNLAAVANALRHQPAATLLIRGAEDAEYMVEKAAEWLGLPWRVMRTVRDRNSPSIEDELRTIISELEGRRAILLVELTYGTEGNFTLVSVKTGRLVSGVPLPSELQLVVSVDGEPSEAARAADTRYYTALSEGLGRTDQVEFLRRQAARAGWRDVEVEVLPPPNEERAR